MIQIKNYTAGENQMIGFIKYINYKDGYGYISIPDRAKKDIVSQIAITSWTPRGKNLAHGWSRRIYP